MMGFDICDNFYEPSAYDLMVEELKTTLRKSIAKEWVEKMNELRRENNELQEIKENFEKIKRDYENKKQQCEIEKERVIRNAKRMRLKELMQDVQKSYWKISWIYAYTKKCNKCNENRKIIFNSPSGKECSEDCKCSIGKQIYVPMRVDIYEISLRNSYDKTANVFFREQKGCNSNYYYQSAEYYGNKIIVEDDANFASLDIEAKNDFYFVSEEKCQEFCDWYNKEILKVDTDKYKIENKVNKTEVTY